MSIIEQALRLAQHKAKQVLSPSPAAPTSGSGSGSAGTEPSPTTPPAVGQTTSPPAASPGLTSTGTPPQKPPMLPIPPWLLPTLGVLIVLWAVPNLLLRPPRPAAIPAVSVPPSPQPPAPAAKPSPTPPTPLGMESPRPTLKVEGIVSGMGDAVAVINGYTVREGDTIGGALVTHIGRDTVTVLWQDQEMTLRPRQ